MIMQDDDKLRAFLDELYAMPESAVDYQSAPKTTASDWDDAEVLLPVTRGEFNAIQEFIAERRAKENGSNMSQTLGI
jgi:hypothetical protein